MTARARRPSGSAPFWAPGSQITWREGDGPMGTGDVVVDTSRPHFAQPLIVVQDDPTALAAWLPTGSPVLRAARADGLGKRDDPETMFTAPLVQERGVHALYDQLRIAPTGQPWSVWVFFEEGSGSFAGWYVNFEKPHVRDDSGVYTSDHVLDLVISPEREMIRKDEDELALALDQQVFDAMEVAGIQADAAAVESLIAEWASPFSDGWEKFRPDPLWPIPTRLN
jgi:predicted RNA-binding protein associated with RNAse of E/G family